MRLAQEAAANVKVPLALTLPSLETDETAGYLSMVSTRLYMLFYK